MKRRVLLLALLLAACSKLVPQTSTAGEPVEQLFADLGGTDQAFKTLDGLSQIEKAQLLARYGIRFREEAQSAFEKQNIQDCVQFFPSSDRNLWINITSGGQNQGDFYIDSYGRPYMARKNLTSIAAAPRSDACQSTVGSWGDSVDPANDYDGGHMIGSQLGGWGKRANMVPQNANFNRGNYAQLENKVSLCPVSSSNTLNYFVQVTYPNTSTLIPGTFKVEMTFYATGNKYTASFQNVYQGGTSGTTTRTNATGWLTAQGC